MTDQTQTENHTRAAADITAALSEWSANNPERSADTYAKKLIDTARIFEICAAYHTRRGDYATADNYVWAADLRNLARGFSEGWATPEIVGRRLENVAENLKQRAPAKNDNAANIINAVSEWLETETQQGKTRTGHTYARRLKDTARIFEMCGEYHTGRGDYTAADDYVWAGELWNLARGIICGYQTRYTAATNLEAICQAIDSKENKETEPLTNPIARRVFRERVKAQSAGGVENPADPNSESRETAKEKSESANR